MKEEKEEEEDNKENELYESLIQKKSFLINSSNNTNNYKIQFPIQFIDFIFFGSGRFQLIPYFLGIFHISIIISVMIFSPEHLGLGQGWLHLSLPLKYFIEICILIELLVNLWFGYLIVLQYREWIKKCSISYNIPIQQLYSYFEFSAIINIILYIITGSLLVLCEVLEEKYQDGRHQTILTIIYDLSYCLVVYGISYYLCGIWISISLVLNHIISISIQTQLNISSLLTHQIQSSISLLYQEMAIISQLWKYNHIVRILTGIILSSTLLYTGKLSYEYGFIYSSIFHIWTAILYYSAMWMTVFSAGYTNDYLYDKITLQLYELDTNKEYLSYVTSSSSLPSNIMISKLSMSSQQSRHSQPQYTYDDYISLKNSLQLNLLTIRSAVGLRFIGVPMTKEKTLALGSLIFTIITIIIFRLN